MAATPSTMASFPALLPELSCGWEQLLLEIISMQDSKSFSSSLSLSLPSTNNFYSDA